MTRNERLGGHEGGTGQATRAARDTALRAERGDELVRAMRRGDVRALREFVDRYQRMLLAEGRRFGFTPDECADRATNVVHDAAIRLLDPSGAVPQNVESYLITTFLNATRNAVRRASRESARAAPREPKGGDGAVEPSAGEAAMALVSEDAVRASRGVDWTDAAPTPALERLVTALDEGISADERLLLTLVSHYVPRREIAAELGVKESAVAMRIWRLRERLKEALLRHARSYSAAERRELARFFRRTASVSPAHLAALGVADGPQAAAGTTRNATEDER